MSVFLAVTPAEAASCRGYRVPLVHIAYAVGDGGRLLLMLCDGMGHGKEAHDLSEKTLELLLLLMVILRSISLD